MFSIRTWKESDLQYISESVTRERWGHTLRDIARCWKLEPEGCFIAEIQGRSVGHVFSINYGKMGWIGFLIVNPEERAKGLGAALMRKAIEYLQSEGCATIRLDAAQEAVTLYKRLAFREEYDSLRFAKPLRNPVGTFSQEGVSQLVAEDIDKVAEFDSRYFGCDRRRVLLALLKDEPDQCFVSKGAGGTLGYIMCRRIRDAHWAGPWVCEDKNVAINLLQACLKANGETELRVGVPSPNKIATEIMRTLGFRVTGKSNHMVWGESKSQDVSRIYGIGGPEKG